MPYAAVHAMPPLPGGRRKKIEGKVKMNEVSRDDNAEPSGILLMASSCEGKAMARAVMMKNKARSVC